MSYAEARALMVEHNVHFSILAALDALADNAGLATVAPAPKPAPEPEPMSVPEPKIKAKRKEKKK